MNAFSAKLFKWPGPGGWHFVKVPKKCWPPQTHAWGRTPVRATVDGVEWNTSVWRDRTHGCLLPVPKKVRGAKSDGDSVRVTLDPRA